MTGGEGMTVVGVQPSLDLIIERPAAMPAGRQAGAAPFRVEPLDGGGGAGR